MSIITSKPSPVNPPFHDLVLSSSPGSCVQQPDSAGATTEPAAESGDHCSEISISPSFPNGVPALLHNCILNNSKMMLLRDGFISDSEIVDRYEAMRIKMNGKRSCLMVSEKGEVVTFKARSRWNSEFDYGGYVGRKLLDEVRGLRKCSHLILTLDPKKVDDVVPGWWCYGDKEFLSVSVGFLVSEFLRALRIYKKRKGEPWNFLCWVMEFHESGYVHIHLMFYGGWIAPLSVLTDLWKFSDPNGVRLAKRNNGQCTGASVASYLTHYLAKDLNKVGENHLKRCAAFIWFFGKRLFNVRHHFNVDGQPSWRISGKEYKIKWKRYEPEYAEIPVVDEVKPEFDYQPSEMFLRWKARGEGGSSS